MFTDEPLYLANSLFDALAVPWSTKLPAYFQQLKGYDIRQHLPKLFIDRDDFRRVRFDFYDVASRLFRESWTKQYYQWCDKHGLKLTGHFQAEESLRLQIQWTGDVMAHYQWMHWPGVDKLHRDVDDVIQTKQVSSITDQLGKERYLCEAWGVSGPHVAIFHRKWVGDWLMALGVNFINPHLSHYSLRGPRKRDCPPSLLHQAPWWDDEHVLSDYQARVCALMSQGRRRVDVLMLQPLSSVWCDYSPMQWDSGYAPVTVYDKPYDDLAKRLLARQIDFHIGNETIMAEHARVEGGRLVVGQQSYGIVVLPPMVNLRASTLKLLQQVLAGGGTVIVTGPMPTHVDGVPAVVELKGSLHAMRVVNVVPLIADRMPSKVVAIDRLTGKPARDVIIHSRDVAGGAHHFIANTAELREVQLTIQFPDTDWTVSIVEIYAAPLNDAKQLQVTLAPAGSLLLVTGTPAAGSPPALLGSEAVLGSTGEPLGYAGTFSVTLQDANILRVDEVELTIGDHHYAGPLAGAWQHYYGVADGTPFRAVMRFRASAAIEGCDAIIDSAEYLDSIKFNGESVVPARTPGEPHLLNPAKVWKDIALTRVPLPPLRIGVNELVLTGQKLNVAKPGGLSHRRTTPNYEPRETQLEEILIAGRFSLQEISAARTRSALSGKSSVAISGPPFYAGRATRSHCRTRCRWVSPCRCRGWTLLQLASPSTARDAAPLRGNRTLSTCRKRSSLASIALRSTWRRRSAT